MSHRLAEVIDIANDVTVLRDGRLVDTIANQGLTTDMLAELIVGRSTKTGSGRPGGITSNTRVLELLGVSGGPIDDVDLTLYEGEVVGIAGLVGSGRTSLLRMLGGSLPVAAGSVTLRGVPVAVSSPQDAIKSGFTYLPENRPTEGAFSGLSIRDNLSVIDIDKYRRHGMLSARQERRDADLAMEQFGVVAQSQDQVISTLSGGNQQKVIVARVMRTHPDVLLLDEPSQGVDVGARAEIHGHIRDYVDSGAVALVVSSDLEELAQWCDRVVVLVGGQITAERSAPGLDPAELAGLTEQSVTVHADGIAG